MADKRRNVVTFDPDAGQVEAEIVIGRFVHGRYTGELLRLNSQEFQTIADDENSGTQPNVYTVSEGVANLDKSVLGWTVTLASTKANGNQKFSIGISYWQLDPDDGKLFQLPGSPLTATGNVKDEPTLGLFTIFESG